MTEESVIQGIIDKNVLYFTENIKNPSHYYISYLNQYIKGDLIDTDVVYENIINLSKANLNIFVNIIDNYLEYDILNIFNRDFHGYLINIDIDIAKKTELLISLYNSKNIQQSLLDLDDLDKIFDYIIGENLVTTKYLFTLSLKLLKNKNIRPHILDYIDMSIDTIKSKKNIEPIISVNGNFNEIKSKENNFTINITILLILLWDNGITNEKIKNISVEDTNFLGVSFYKIHKLIEHGILSIYEEKKYRTTELLSIRKELENPAITAYTKEILIEKKDLIINRMNCLYKIIKNTYITQNITKFLDNSIFWINNRHDKLVQIDDILENINIYYQTNNIILTENSTILICELFSSNTISKNPNIKLDFIYIVYNYLCDLIEKTSKSLAISNYIEYNENIEKIIHTLLPLFNSIKNKEIYNISDASIFSAIFINTIFINDEYKYTFDKNMNKDFFKEFIYNILNNYQTTLDEILTQLSMINNEESESDMVNSRTINKCKKKINSYNKLLIIFSLFFKNITKHYSNIILDNELKQCFMNILVMFINKMTIEQSRYKIKDKSNITFKPLDTISLLKDIILNITYNKHNETKFIELISEHELYKETGIIRLLSILNKKDIIKTLEYDRLNLLNMKITDYSEQHKKKEDIEIPDELCDPIMSTLIKNPIMLPNDIVMDYEVISRHLLTSKTNPFNREELTIEILDDYNKKKDVIEKLNKFKLKLDKFL